jgi:hypothetical protein
MQRGAGPNGDLHRRRRAADNVSAAVSRSAAEFRGLHQSAVVCLHRRLRFRSDFLERNPFDMGDPIRRRRDRCDNRWILTPHHARWHRTSVRRLQERLGLA